MKHHELLKLSELFAGTIIKKASLTTDMAHRIMYSVIQSISKNDDPKLLEISAAGASKLIQYGTSACIKEARHVTDYDLYKLKKLTDPVTVEYTNILKEINETNINRVLLIQNEVLNIFENEKFYPYYGGRGWINIIKTLIKLTQVYRIHLNLNPANPDYVENMKKIIMYMNIFDGTAHNTGSIYSKLISLEERYDQEEAGGSPIESYDIQTAAENNIENMMNAKELGNERDVFDKVFKNLDRVAPYTEYLHKIRDKDYFMPRDTATEEKFIIIKKSLLGHVMTLINRMLHISFSSERDKVLVDLSDVESQLKMSLSSFCTNTKSVIGFYRLTDDYKLELYEILNKFYEYCLSLAPQILEVILAAPDAPVSRHNDSSINIARALKKMRVVEKDFISIENMIKDKVIELFSQPTRQNP